MEFCNADHIQCMVQQPTGLPVECVPYPLSHDFTDNKERTWRLQFGRRFRQEYGLCKFGLVVVLLFQLGCGTSPAIKAEYSRAITSGGRASIENTVKKGFNSTRITVLKIDGELVQPGKSKGVRPLSPGMHEITIQAWFSRMANLDLVIDSGVITLALEAKQGVRYRVTGRKLGNESVNIWIEDANTGNPVTEVSNVELTATAQNIPIVMPIPGQ